MKTVNIIGAGLAGSEACYQLIKRGIKVNLYEMRLADKMTPAHKTKEFGELVCSNSLRSDSPENAVGLLKEEMRIIDSLVMKAADATKVPAGGALAVDRTLFSAYITKYLKNSDLVNIIDEEITEIPEGPTIIATGPLTSDAFSKAIKDRYNEEYLYFFDAVAPIVTLDSIDQDIVYLKSRYDKGEAAYFNCPMNKEQFDKFYHELVRAERAVSHDFEMKVFEGCMAIEDIASRGEQTLLFGPMKPVGLENPHNGERPYAVVQLRQDDALKTLYNLVGFQTHLKWPEQKRILRMIPGLENVEIVRYGLMHRNTYINGPHILNKYYQTKDREDLFFAGQITGVEGYIESASSGMVAALNMYKYLNGEEMIDFGMGTSIGSLQNYVARVNSKFVPMNANFCLVEPLEGRMRKRERKIAYGERGIKIIRDMAKLYE